MFGGVLQVNLRSRLFLELTTDLFDDPLKKQNPKNIALLRLNSGVGGNRTFIGNIVIYREMLY